MVRNTIEPPGQHGKDDHAPRRDGVSSESEANYRPSPVMLFTGWVAPIVLASWAIWFGFVQQRVYLPNSLRDVSIAMYADTHIGIDAIRVGMAVLALAVGINGCLFWRQFPFSRTLGIILTNIGALIASVLFGIELLHR